MRGYRLGLKDLWMITMNDWGFNERTGGVYPYRQDKVAYRKALTTEELMQALIRSGIPSSETASLYWSRSFIVPVFPSDGLLLSQVADKHSLHHPGDGAVFHNAFAGYTAWWRRTSKMISSGVDGVYQCVWSSGLKFNAGQYVDITRGRFRVIPYQEDTLEALFL